MTITGESTKPENHKANQPQGSGTGVCRWKYFLHFSQIWKPCENISEGTCSEVTPFFNQRSFKPLYIRLEAPKHIQAQCVFGSSDWRPRWPWWEYFLGLQCTISAVVILGHYLSEDSFYRVRSNSKSVVNKCSLNLIFCHLWATL